MAQPMLSQVHIQRAVANAAQRYTNPSFIYDQIAPIVTVAKSTDKMFIFDKAEWFRDVAETRRAPGTDAPRGGYTLSTADYTCEERAQASPVYDQIKENADEPLRPYEDAAAWCMHIIKIRCEREASALFFTGANWTTTSALSGTNRWDDYVNSDPCNDISSYIDTVRGLTGMEPNTLVLGANVWSHLKLHPDALDRIKYTQTGILTEALAAAWLGVKRILIGKAIYNTTAEGQAATMADIWGKSALLLYVTSGPSITEPSAAYTFQRKEIKTKSWREESKAQDVVEVSVETVPKIVGADLGALYTTVVS